MTSDSRLVTSTRALVLSFRTTWPRTSASLLPPGPSARPHARPCSRSWRGQSCELPGWRRCSVWLSHPCSGRLRPPSSSSLHSRTYASSGSCSYWRSWCYRVCKHFARLKNCIQLFSIKILDWSVLKKMNCLLTRLNYVWILCSENGLFYQYSTVL